MRMLIADDEAVIRRGLVSLDWKSIGIEEVFSVRNGDEAKKLLLAVPIDIVILDIQMPEMSGLELAEMIKEHSMDTAVVLLTGYSEFDYAVKAIKSGVIEYLLKPVNPRELLHTIADVKLKLEQKRYQRQIVREHEREEGTFDTVLQVRNQFSKVSDVILDILTDIAGGYREPLSLGELAEKYHFSSSYLSKRIRQETSYPYIDILNAARLMNAAALLQEGEKVNMACEKAGFNDQRYFSQLFRRCFGCSPSEYRKQEHTPAELRFHIVLENTANKSKE